MSDVCSDRDELSSNSSSSYRASLKATTRRCAGYNSSFKCKLPLMWLLFNRKLLGNLNCNNKNAIVIYWHFILKLHEKLHNFHLLYYKNKVTEKFFFFSKKYKRKTWIAKVKLLSYATIYGAKKKVKVKRTKFKHSVNVENVKAWKGRRWHFPFFIDVACTYACGNTCLSFATLQTTSRFLIRNFTFTIYIQYYT